mgnify:CR=1 FL=1
MKKFVLMVVVTAVTLVGAFSFIPKIKTPSVTKKDDISIPSESTENNNLLAKMTLEEKIGQMMIVSYRKPEMDEELKNMLTVVKPGGFIFFSENFSNYDKTMVLINSIKDTANVPLFLAIDQEGGRVQRLKTMSGITVKNIPSMSEIGKTNSEDIAYQVGVDIANDLKKMGFNLDFAPVMDVNSNSKNTVIGNRSFGTDPYLVAKMGLSLDRGLSDNEIIPTYKHFPGHGDTVADSHVELPIINKTKEELMRIELVPFVEAIKNNADMIMIGHLAVPNITGNYKPASLSYEVITNLLKNELGYKNLVITDALNMKAITDNYTEKEIYELAINAGVDILLMPSDPIKAVSIIKELINEGKVKEEKINNSVRKILELKERYNII